MQKNNRNGYFVRKVTRPTTAKCTLPMHIAFLISEPKSATCTRLAEVTGISHNNSVNRFLQRESYQPKDIFDEVSKDISLVSGVFRASRFNNVSALSGAI